MCLGTLGTPGQGGAPCEPPSRAPWPGTTAYLAVLAHAPDEQGVLQGHIEAPAGDADVWGRRGDITLGMTAPQPSVGTPQPCPAVSRTHSPPCWDHTRAGDQPWEQQGGLPLPSSPTPDPRQRPGGPCHPSRVGHSQVTAAVPGARRAEGRDKPGLLSPTALCPHARRCRPPSQPLSRVRDVPQPHTHLRCSCTSAGPRTPAALGEETGQGPGLEQLLPPTLQ